MLVKKQQLELDMEELTGSISGFHLYAEYIMSNARLDEAQAGIKIAGRNINNLGYTDDTNLMAESEELKGYYPKCMKNSYRKAQFSHSVNPYSLQPHRLHHARLPCPTPTSGSCSNSCPLSWWCHSTIKSSVIPFSSCLQSFPASMSFPRSWVVCIKWPKFGEF